MFFSHEFKLLEVFTNNILIDFSFYSKNHVPNKKKTCFVKIKKIHEHKKIILAIKIYFFLPEFKSLLFL
jgi:hypothetical protein